MRVANVWWRAAFKVVYCVSVKLEAGRNKSSFGKRATFHFKNPKILHWDKKTVFLYPLLCIEWCLRSVVLGVQWAAVYLPKHWHCANFFSKHALKSFFGKRENSSHLYFEIRIFILGGRPVGWQARPCFHYAHFLILFFACLFKTVPPKGQLVCFKYRWGILQLNHS